MGEFARHTTIIVFMRIVVSLVALVGSIVLARSLGPEHMGVYAILLLIPALALKFANAGVESSTIYRIGKGTDSLGTIVGTNSILGALFGLGTAGAVGLIAWMLRDSYFVAIPWPLILLSISAIPFMLFSHFLGGIFLGTKRFGTFSMVRIASDLLFLLFIVVFVVLLRRGIQGAVLANIIAASLVACVTYIAVLKINGGISWCVSFPYVRRLFSYGFQSYVAGLLGFINYKIDILLVNAFAGTLIVGYYSLATNIGEGLWLVASAAALILFSKISSDHDIESINKFTPIVTRNILFITLCSGFVLLMTGRWIIPFLYSGNFIPSLMPLYLLLPGVVAMSVSSILANDYAGRGRPMINVYLAGCGLAVKLILNALLIPPFGMNGAAIATSVSYIVFTLLSLLVYRSISNNSLQSIVAIKRSDFAFYKQFFHALARIARQQLNTHGTARG